MNFKRVITAMILSTVTLQADWQWETFRNNDLIDLPRYKNAFFEGCKTAKVVGQLSYILTQEESEIFNGFSDSDKSKAITISNLPDGLQPQLTVSNQKLTISLQGKVKQKAQEQSRNIEVNFTLNGNVKSKVAKIHYHELNTNWTSPITGRSYDLIFNDEFTADKVDKKRWNYRHEVMRPLTRTIKYNETPVNIYTTADCSYQKNGKMSLKVEHKKGKKGINTGGLITSETFQPRYGYFETKVDFSECSGWGYWPAFWLYFDQHYRDSIGTEIDIFEFIPAQNKIYQTLHWYENLPNSKKDQHLRNFHTTDFPNKKQPATFGLEWTPTELIFYIDGKVSKKLKKSDNERFVPSAFQYVCYSMSAGEWGGNVADPANKLPAVTKFDYCRVYQQPEQKYLFKKPNATKWQVKKSLFTESIYYPKPISKQQILTGNPDEVSESINN